MCFTEARASSAASGIMVWYSLLFRFYMLLFPPGCHGESESPTKYHQRFYLYPKGNKGAVAVRLTYRPQPTPAAPTPVPIILTFVNSHLAASDDQLDRRNADFHDISRRLAFGPCIEYACGPLANDIGKDQAMLDIYASDFLLWLVSYFKYRITRRLTTV